MPVNMNAKSYDFEWLDWGKMTLNVKMKKDGDSKYLNEYAQRLWMKKIEEEDGSKCQTEVGLNA